MRWWWNPHSGTEVSLVGVAAGCPGLSVVGFGPGVGDVAAVGGAGLVVQGGGYPLGFGEEPSCPAQVQWLGGAAEDGGDDAGPAGQPPGLGGGDHLPGVQPGRGQPAA
jgi:hypothetical protein